MMAFARDKLYNGYLRRKMALIASNVKAREIVPHLPCLTTSDREEIEAKRETSGNYAAMQHLLDCLRRRENWPEEFIAALEACEQRTMAAEIRAEYNSLRGPNNPSPPSPPTTVVMAHVHPAPSASRPVSAPESSQAAVSPPPEAAAPPEPATRASPPPEAPLQPEAPPNPDTPPPPPPKAAPSSEPAPQLPQSPQARATPPPSTPPPSPEPPRHQAATPPPPQRAVQAHQEPEENSEMDPQDGSGDKSLIPDKASAGDGEVSVDSEATADPGPAVEQREAAAPSLPHPRQATAEEDRTPQSLVTTPEKPPVQETVPPVDQVAAAGLQPEETSEPTATQVMNNSQQAQTTDAASPPRGIDVPDASLCDTVCLSKPGQLLSIQQQHHNSPTIPAEQQPPYSGNSERLEISDAVPDPESSAQVPAPASPPPRQDNGVVTEPLPYNNEPEENHYESVSLGSLGEVRVNVGRVAEEASIQNHDGQDLRPQAQILNGQAAKEPASAPPASANAADTVSNFNAPSESALEQQDPEKKTYLSPNAKSFLTAAGVSACVLMVAWRLKRI
uniref:mitochondrial antiviral-signaling protein isoform X1 n=2 Tax=Centroberyx gerrardi TaxID=166262 RepID=UPI003AB0D643